MGRTMFEVWSQTKRCLSSITKRWTHLSLFDVWRNDVRVCSINDLVNLIKTPYASWLHFMCLKHIKICKNMRKRHWIRISGFKTLFISGDTMNASELNAFVNAEDDIHYLKKSTEIWSSLIQCFRKSSKTNYQLFRYPLTQRMNH